MTYKQIKELKPEAFKRRCGVQMETFEQMVEILNPHLNRRGKRGGQCKLSVEDQLLVVLEYWREDRTQFHIGTSWNISESAVCQLINKVERILMDSGKFRLPGKKQLYQQADNWQVIVVDVTESPIERPKKADASAFGGAKPYALRSPSGDTPRFARLQRALHQAAASLLQRQEKAPYLKSTSGRQPSNRTNYLYCFR